MVGAAALSARLLRAWPLHRSGGPRREADDEAASSPGRERRARWAALAICAGLTGYSLGLCLAIEEANHRCDGFLPAPYHPKGWRSHHVSEGHWRVLRRIPADRALPPAEHEQLRGEQAHAAQLNELRSLVQRSVKVHVFVPLAFAWLVGLLLARPAPRFVRLVACPLLVSLVIAAYLMVTRGYFTALMGD